MVTLKVLGLVMCGSVLLGFLLGRWCYKGMKCIDCIVDYAKKLEGR